MLVFLESVLWLLPRMSISLGVMFLHHGIRVKHFGRNTPEVKLCSAHALHLGTSDVICPILVMVRLVPWLRRGIPGFSTIK